jgi:hypothetical protein
VTGNVMVKATGSDGYADEFRFRNKNGNLESTLRPFIFFFRFVWKKDVRDMKIENGFDDFAHIEKIIKNAAN